MAKFDYPFTYRGNVLNQHQTALGAYDDTYEKDTTLVSVFDYSGLSVRDQIEGLHLDSGADLGVASKEFRRVALRGLLKGSTAAKLEDREARFRAAFDVEEAQRTSPSTEGVHGFDFYSLTEVPPGGLTSPVREMFLCRPRGFPVIYDRRNKGFTSAFAVELIAPDPLQYIYTPTTVSFSAGAGWEQDLPNWEDGIGVVTYPTLSIVMGGAGHASLTITDGTTSLVLDMSGETSGTFIVNMKTGSIKKGSTHKGDLRTSDVDTFFGVEPDGSTWTISNTTNVTSALATYRMARS